MSEDRAPLFWAGARGLPNGNNARAAQLAVEIREIVRLHAARSPRTLQTYLGPSEIGTECDRQVVGKMAGLPATNHVSDPWPSVVGTAVHAWLADAFTAANGGLPQPRWVAEQRVVPDDRHPGTADLYDGLWQEVDDHKVLGEASLNKIRTRGPSRRYRVQLGLYGIGFMRLGLPVRAVNLIAYPRSRSSLDGLYVWNQPMDAGFLAEIAGVLADTDRRHAMAGQLASGAITLRDIPAAPDDDECYFCPFYRPGRDEVGGCAGTKEK